MTKTYCCDVASGCMCRRIGLSPDDCSDALPKGRKTGAHPGLAAPYGVDALPALVKPHPDTVRIDFHLTHETTWYPGRGGKPDWGDGVNGFLYYSSRFSSGRHEVQASSWREAVDLAIAKEAQ